MNILQTDLMGLGLGPLLSQALGADIELAKTSTGSASTDAYAITKTITQFTVVGSGEGARLPLATPGAVHIVSNMDASGGTALLLYPGAGDQLNDGTATTGTISIADNKAALCVAISDTHWLVWLVA